MPRQKKAPPLDREVFEEWQRLVFTARQDWPQPTSHESESVRSLAVETGGAMLSTTDEIAQCSRAKTWGDLEKGLHAIAGWAPPDHRQA